MTSADGTEGTHHRVVVIGGGNAGLSVAGRLRRMGVHDVVVVEPRAQHLYKPLFSHIAGGRAPASMAVREQGSVTPKGVGWIKDSVSAIHPEHNSVSLASGADNRNNLRCFPGPKSQPAGSVAF